MDPDWQIKIVKCKTTSVSKSKIPVFLQTKKKTTTIYTDLMLLLPIKSAINMGCVVVGPQLFKFKFMSPSETAGLLNMFFGGRPPRFIVNRTPLSRLPLTVRISPACADKTFFRLLPSWSVLRLVFGTVKVVVLKLCSWWLFSSSSCKLI